MKFNVTEVLQSGKYTAKQIKAAGLPYLIKLVLKDSLEDLEPLTDEISVSIEERKGIFAAYVKLDQFKKGVKYSSKYVIFEPSKISTFYFDSKEFSQYSGSLTYIDSNVIDANKSILNFRILNKQL